MTLISRYEHEVTEFARSDIQFILEGPKNTTNNFLYAIVYYFEVVSSNDRFLQNLSVVSHRLLQTSKIKVFTSEPTSATKVKPQSTL